MHDKGLGRLDVVDCLIEAMLRLGREAALDLDRIGTLPFPELQEQVDLRARSRAIKAGLGLPLKGRDQGNYRPPGIGIFEAPNQLIYLRTRR